MDSVRTCNVTSGANDEPSFTQQTIFLDSLHLLFAVLTCAILIWYLHRQYSSCLVVTFFWIRLFSGLNYLLYLFCFSMTIFARHIYLSRATCISFDIPPPSIGVTAHFSLYLFFSHTSSAYISGPVIPQSYHYPLFGTFFCLSLALLVE